MWIPKTEQTKATETTCILSLKYIVLANYLVILVPVPPSAHKVYIMHNKPPSFSWLENVNILRYFGSSLSVSFSRISSCGRQFLTCGGPSSSRRRANLAADMAKPRSPSPHSFSALQHNHGIQNCWKTQERHTSVSVKWSSMSVQSWKCSLLYTQGQIQEFVFEYCMIHEQ